MWLVVSNQISDQTNEKISFKVSLKIWDKENIHSIKKKGEIKGENKISKISYF